MKNIKKWHVGQLTPPRLIPGLGPEEVESFVADYNTIAENINLPPIPSAYKDALPPQIKNTLSDLFTIMDVNSEVVSSWVRTIYYDLQLGGRAEDARYYNFNYSDKYSEMIKERADITYALLLYSTLRLVIL